MCFHPNIIELDSLDGTILPWSELADRGGEEGADAGRRRLGVLLEARQRPVLRETPSHWLCGERESVLRMIYQMIQRTLFLALLVPKNMSAGI